MTVRFRLFAISSSNLSSHGHQFRTVYNAFSCAAKKRLSLQQLPVTASQHLFRFYLDLVSWGISSFILLVEPEQHNNPLSITGNRLFDISWNRKLVLTISDYWSHQI